MYDSVSPCQVLLGVRSPVVVGGVSRAPFFAIAVGIPVARYPPHGPARALISACGSYLGCVAAKRTLG